MGLRPHPRVRARVRACAMALALAGTIAALLAPAGPTNAASSSVNVTLTVLGATSIDASGCSTGSTYANSVAADSPLHHWKLDERPGATTAAATVGAATGTYAGAHA